MNTCIQRIYTFQQIITRIYDTYVFKKQSVQHQQI